MGKARSVEYPQVDHTDRVVYCSGDVHFYELEYTGGLVPMMCRAFLRKGKRACVRW